MKRLFVNVLILALAVISIAGCGQGKTDQGTGANLTVAGKCVEAFEKNIAGESDIVKVAENILATDGLIPLATATMEVEEGYLNGFQAEITGFNKGVMLAPMIGSIPFIGYIFETDDVEALKETLNANADLRWNICTEADELQITSVDSYVFIVMAPKDFDNE